MLGRYQYTASTLTPGEEIEIVGRLHYFALIIPSFWTIISAIAFVFALIMDLSAPMQGKEFVLVNFMIWTPVMVLFLFTSSSWLKRNLIEMVCTNKRVIKRTGIVNVTTEELQCERIESVEIRQSIFGRLFNYGDILFSGTGTSKIVFTFVNQPRLMKQMIDDIISRPINPQHSA